MYTQWCKVKKRSDMSGFYHDARLFADSHPDPLARQSEYLNLNFWRKDYEKKILHVWFEQKELRDFLRDELPIKDLDGIKRYLIEEGEVQTTHVPGSGNDLEWVRHDIALHIPNELDGYVFSFIIVHDGTISLLYSGDSGTGQLHESELEQLKARSDESAENLVRDFKLAVNLLAYMRCFPECVREGVPADNNGNTERYLESSIHLRVSDKITETVRGAMRPHWRKGHFRYLSSEFYTKKRGQLVWVSETMVNAKSKTVEMSDDEKKLNDFQSE